MKNTEDDKDKQKWEQQLDMVQERLKHGDEPEAIKEICDTEITDISKI